MVTFWEHQFRNDLQRTIEIVKFILTFQQYTTRNFTNNYKSSISSRVICVCLIYRKQKHRCCIIRHFTNTEAQCWIFMDFLISLSHTMSYCLIFEGPKNVLSFSISWLIHDDIYPVHFIGLAH